MKDWLMHAFAIEPAGPAQPTDAQRDVIDRLCREIVTRELSTPALIFLESVRPLHYVGAQATHFLTPFLAPLGGEQSGRDLADFLEQHGSIDFICQRIEELEQAREGKEGKKSDG